MSESVLTSMSSSDSTIQVSLQEQGKSPPSYGSLADKEREREPLLSSGVKKQYSGQAANGNAVSAVSFHDIEYQISSCCGTRTKTILHGVR